MYEILSIFSLLAAQTALPSDTTTVKEADLKEVVITAKKEIVKSNGEIITYDVTQDNSSKGATLIDALKKVPMITVDGEDKIKINGDSNFKIYVNGKEEPMLQANYDKIFKAMPANSVQKIEVITEPGAKYDAEGSGGILNLFTETSQRKDGYSGTLSASLSNRDYYFSVLGRMKYRNFSADANVTYGANAFSPDSNDQTFTTIDRDAEINYLQIENMHQSFRYNFTNASLNTSWQPNENNLFTMGGSVMALDAKIKDISSSTSMYDRADNLIWFTAQKMNGGLKTFSTSANASYQHYFGDRQHFLVGSWLFNYGRNPIDFLSQTTETTPGYEGLPYSLNYNINYSREHTFQLDYSKPFSGDKHKLETGAKAILRHNSATGHSATGLAQDELNKLPGSEVDLTQRQDIYALYASYTGSFGNISTKAGVRYEHTRMGLHNNLDHSKDFIRHLNDIVPNVAVTYLFSPASNLRLAYQMRITRPSIQQMNPYQMDILGTMVQEGNPNLESERSNKISLTYTNFGRLMGGNVYVDYKYIDNALVEYNYFTTGEDNEIIIHATTANIGHKQELGLGGFYNINISSKMNLSVNGRVAYLTMKSRSPYFQNHGWTGNYGASWNYTGPADIKFSAYGGQTFKVINLQGSFSGWYYYGIGISRGLLKDAITLSLTASNFLQSHVCFKSHTEIGSQVMDLVNKRNSWKVGLSLSWNFGHLSERTKKTDALIENDDLSKSSNGGGGIGI